MANSYPTSANSYATGSSSVTLSAAGHASAHNSYELKIGTGSSTPTASTLLRGTGTGTSAWAQAVLTTDVTGTLPVANGGTGAATLTGIIKGSGTSAFTAVTAPSGTIVGTSDSQALTGKTYNGLTVTTSTGTLTIANSSSLITSGGNSVTVTSTGTTTVTLPTSGTLATLTGTETLTNKRVTSRVQSVSDAATVTPNADNDDCVDITAIAQAFTIANPSGTPTNFQKLLIRIKDNATARAITWGNGYAAGGVALPSTTILSKILNLGFIYNTANSLNKWQCVASAQEA